MREILRYAELMVLAVDVVIAEKVTVISAKHYVGLFVVYSCFRVQVFASATKGFTDLIVKTRETVQDHVPTEGNVTMAVVTAIISVTERLANSVSAQSRLRTCLHHQEISRIRPSNRRLRFQLRIGSARG
jgi:hypothetical protein